ncbi:uncharacterized protein LOC141658452 [Silene latifolia]|uniref:uncharacterized protein LOC141658452 n=1 Tax=Silene latifolia TaxID=37657 RepID=UPI003D77F8E6
MSSFNQGVSVRFHPIRNHRVPSSSVLLNYRKKNVVYKVYGGKMMVDGDKSKWIVQSGGNDMPYLKCREVGEFDVNGRIPRYCLKPNTTYEGVFQVSVDPEHVTTWIQNDVTVVIKGPQNQQLASQSFSMGVGHSKLFTNPFKTPKKVTGDLTYSLHQKSDKAKGGLTIKCFTLTEIIA